MKKSLLILSCLVVCLSGLGACSSTDDGNRSTASDDTDQPVKAYKPAHSEIAH